MIRTAPYNKRRKCKCKVMKGGRQALPRGRMAEWVEENDRERERQREEQRREEERRRREEERRVRRIQREMRKVSKEITKLYKKLNQYLTEDEIDLIVDFNKADDAGQLEYLQIFLDEGDEDDMRAFEDVVHFYNTVMNEIDELKEELSNLANQLSGNGMNGGMMEDDEMEDEDEDEDMMEGDEDAEGIFERIFNHMVITHGPYLDRARGVIDTPEDVKFLNIIIGTDEERARREDRLNTRVMDRFVDYEINLDDKIYPKFEDIGEEMGYDIIQIEDAWDVRPSNLAINFFSPYIVEWVLEQRSG